MKNWTLSIEDAKGKSKGKFFGRITSGNGEKTYSSEVIDKKVNVAHTFKSLIKAIKEDKFEVVDKTAKKVNTKK